MSLDGALTRFARPGHILCVFDFDGTLSEIVMEPDTARAVPGATEALERLSAVDDVSVGVLSGRIRRELVERFDHPDLILVGEHGHDRGDTGPDGLVPLNGLIDDLTGLVAAAPGSRLEVKSGSVALHTRAVKGNVADVLTDRARGLADGHPGIAVTEGKKVIEFSVTGTDKGAALLELGNDQGVDRILYVGDDVTDENGFAALDPSKDLTVKVGPGDTNAAHRVTDPKAVVELIETLIRLRTSRVS